MEESHPSLPPLTPFQTEGPPIQYPRVNHFSSLSVSEINNDLDCALAALSNPWKGSIPFPAYVINKCNVVTSDTFDIPQDIKICDYLDAQKYPVKSICLSTSTS